MCDISRLKRAIVLSASNFKEFRSAGVSNTSGSDEVSIAQMSRMSFSFPLTTGKFFLYPG